MTRYLDENSGKQIVIETNKALLLKANQSEITSARSGEVDLATKIGKIDSSLSDKVNQSYVDIKFGSMGNTKTFKGTCTNAELLAKTGMSVDDYWYITDLNTNKCWNGIAWGDIGNVLKIGNGTIIPAKTNFFTYDKNLIDRNNLITGKYINYLDGVEAINANYSATDFIEIEPSTSYVCNGGKQGAFYDVNCVYISGFSSSLSITTPSNAKYIRISMFTADINKEQLEKGTIATTYTEHKNIIKQDIIPSNVIKIEDIFTSINRFNKVNAIVNFYVSSTTGLLVSNTTYYATDWIKVKSNTNYVISPCISPQMAYYDVNKTYISGSNDVSKFTTPVNCVYVRLSLKKEYYDSFQLELGNLATTYKNYSYVINSDIIGVNTIDQSKLVSSPVNKVVNVKATGGDYTTISSAIASETGTQYKGVDVIIDDGTYIEELVLKDYINLIGVNRDTVILQSLPSTDNFYNRDVIKGAFNSIVKNLTINAHNVKYCIHADAVGDYTFTLENCVLNKTQIDAYGIAIGLGLRGNQHVKIKNCIIRGDDRGIYMHNLNDQVSNCSLEIENSKITGTNGSGVNLQSLGSNMSDMIILKGNEITGATSDLLIGRRLEFGHNQDDLSILAYGNKVNTYARVLGCQTIFEQPIVTETVITDI